MMASKLTLPSIPFGSGRISRLIVGANTINGGSHLSRFLNEQMKTYFTAERIQEHLSQCEAEGVSAWQSSDFDLDRFKTHRANGGTMQFLSLGSDGPEAPDAIQKLADGGTLGVAHHGERTDRLFKSGKLETIEPFLEQVKSRGMMAGISTHMPDVVDWVEARGWDVDFYMTCVYERHRTREELKSLLGYVPVPLNEVYLEEDPPRMFAAMRRTQRPCLAFKILAAGRLCERQETVLEAFRSTFAQIKPTDAVIVGMYPEYEDQVRLNAEYVRQFG